MPNVLGLPLATVTIETSNNQDWIESFLFLVDNGSGNTDTMDQYDLRGIRFEMEMRRAVGDHEVLIHATTENRWLAIGAFPNYGFLLFQIPVEEISKRVAGTYVADLVASEHGYVRKVMDLTVTITEGVVKWTLEELAEFAHA